MTWLDKIVTPGFIAFQAHCWFAFGLVLVASIRAPRYVAAISASALIAAAFKEFYIDKHFETSQRFVDNAKDFAGYATGVALAVAVRGAL